MHRHSHEEKVVGSGHSWRRSFWSRGLPGAIRRSKRRSRASKDSINKHLHSNHYASIDPNTEGRKQVSQVDQRPIQLKEVDRL